MFDNPSVTVRAAHKQYGSGDTAVQALRSVDLVVGKGEFLAIMGPSGSGKSTLMHCMAGLDHLTSGEITLGDTDLAGLNDKDLTKLRREQVGFIFQAYNLVPTLNAEENITLPLQLAGKEVDRAWFDQIVDVLGLRERLDHKPSALSGGQQQRVAAARALASRPSVVFADEPTGALDSNSSAELLAFLKRAADEFDQTIVMVTHNPADASYADRILFLADGSIVDEVRGASAEDVLDRMKQLDTSATATQA